MREDPLRPDVANMLGQVLGNQDKESIKFIEVRDLSMWTKYEAVNDSHKVILTESLYCTPERGTARAWLLGDLDSFRVYLSIIGKKSEHFKGDFPLTNSQAEYILKAITDLVETFKKETF